MTLKILSSKAVVVICCALGSFCTSAAYPDALEPLKLRDVLKNSRSQKLVLPLEEKQRFDQKFDAPIVADLANRRMFVRQQDELTVYKMAIGRPASKIPYGRTKITLKRRRPTWTPTPEARKRNPFLPRNMSSSGANPLGSRALNLTWQYYLIHGTNDHEKIGRSATWGCMSLAEEDVLEVFSQVRKGYVVDVHKDILFDLGAEAPIAFPEVAVALPVEKPEFVRAMSTTQNTANKVQNIEVADIR